MASPQNVVYQIDLNVVGGNRITSDVNRARTAIDETNASVNRLKLNLGDVGRAFAAYASFNMLATIGKDVVNVTSEFQKFNAVLTNVTGSAEEAAAIMAEIQQFAKVTPFGVAELTNGFVKLANAGFKPTIEQMRNMGDLAASQGKTYDQLIEAILDAQQGQFIRLREFGIRGEKEGDKVSLTFKGIKQTVKFEAGEIRNTILELGKMKGVAGVMDVTSKTIGGQL